jgi:hypothetical protein
MSALVRIDSQRVCRPRWNPFERQQAPSVASSDSSDSHYDNEDYAGELWDELDVLLRAQEDDFIEQYETAPTGVLFDAPATPIVKGPSTPTSPTLSFQHQSAVPSLVSGPSLSPLYLL